MLVAEAQSQLGTWGEIQSPRYDLRDVVVGGQYGAVMGTSSPSTWRALMSESFGDDDWNTIPAEMHTTQLSSQGQGDSLESVEVCAWACACRQIVSGADSGLSIECVPRIAHLPLCTTHNTNSI